MLNFNVRKILVCGIILLFVGASIIPSMSGAVGSTISILSPERTIETGNDECPCLYGLIEEEQKESDEPYNIILDDIPEEWDWRDVDGEDWTTPIKDQIQDVCGSCWAFGALGGLEAMIKIWNNNPAADVDLSEQYMLSCSPGDCNGWYWMQTLNWIQYHGAIPENCLPYEADDTIPCEDKCDEWGELLVGIESHHKVTSNASVIQSALFEYGPLPASMKVYEDFYPEWEGGVYEHTWGNLVFGHCVTIVGYNNSWGGPDEGYWIVKNSWGTEWGEDGWFRIAYGQCDMEKGVYYYSNPNYAENKPQTPSGPSTGNPGVEYTFSSSAVDPDDDNIKYCFDWGDGNTSWSEFVSSGEPVSMSYIWEKEGTYDVKVMVRDEHNLESPWSDPLPVEMPKNKVVVLNPFLQTLFQRFSRLFFLHNNIIRIQ